MLSKIKSALKRIANHPATQLVVARMKQPTTRRGLVVLLASFGVTLAPESADTWFELAIFIVALAAVISDEPKTPAA